MFSLDIHCDDHEFKCLNNKCINKNLLCNGVDDCGENDSTKKDSDEENCLGMYRVDIRIICKKNFGSNLNKMIFYVSKFIYS